MRKIEVLLVLAVLCATQVSAVVIQQITANQDQYASGDLIEVTLYANAKDLEVTADFSRVDSNFNKDAVLVESPQNFVYKVYYPITFSNTRGEGTYQAVFSVYSKAFDSSSVASYNIILNNAIRLNRSSDSNEIQLRVRAARGLPVVNISRIRVEAGKIVVCSSSGCEQLSEADYERARRFVINSGQVEFANVTYDRLKAEILQSANTKISEEITKWINQVIQLNKDLQNNIFDLDNRMTEREDLFFNQTERTQQLLERSYWSNILSVIGVLVLVAASFFLFYLKRNTTWLS